MTHARNAAGKCKTKTPLSGGFVNLLRNGLLLSVDHKWLFSERERIRST